jgi:oligoendopeptidase F
VKSLPKRSYLNPQDKWYIMTLFKTDSLWESTFAKWEKQIAGYKKFKGKLARSARTLTDCLQFDSALDRLAERIGTYAFLKTSEDQGNSTYQRMKGRYQSAATQAAEAASYIRPEILAISAPIIARFLRSKELVPWRLVLERLLRYRPHTLTNKEEHLLAMQGRMSEASNDFFRQLNDADLKWPLVKNEKKELVELGHSSFSAFLHSPSRSVRKEAFEKYYVQYDAHRNSMAAALNGSVQRDIYYAKARGYKSALESSLFHDNVPIAVYDNLIKSVHRHLPAVYRYNDLRRRKMKLAGGVHHYDTYVPILSDLDKRHTWDQAVKVVVESLTPLGDKYTRELERGLTVGGWADKYPNAGKQSGAFSSGSFDAEPFILMNYQPDVLDHVFTLTHEAGHSMHSYYTAKHQSFQ